MKRILLFLIIPALLFGQSNLKKFEKKAPFVRGKAVSLNGSTQYLSKTSPVNLDLNGTERITTQTNRDFETSAGDWTATGNHSVARTTSYYRSGSASLAMTSSAAGDATSNYVSLPSSAFTTIESGKKYTKEFWLRGTGVLGSATYTSDFSAGVDGWSAGAGCNIDGNIDGISGEDNTLRMTTTNATSTHRFDRTTTTIGVTYRLTGRYYIPSANTTTKKVAFQDGGTVIGSINSVNDSWTAVSYTFVATSTTLRVYSYNASDQASYTGTNGDLVYVKDIVVTPITLPTVTLALGSQSKSFSNISCVPGTWTKCPWNFQATDSEVGQEFKLYANQADVIYLDDVSLTQAYDGLLSMYLYNASLSSGGFANMYPFSIRSGASSTNYRFNLGVNKASRTIFSQFADDNTYVSAASVATITDGAWVKIDVVVNRTGTVTLYMNGLQTGTPQDITILGKLASDVPITIGALTTPTACWNGQIGETAIYRFDDITKSNFSASYAYNYGIPKAWTGGGAQTVFWVRWRGNTSSSAFQDWSGNGNNLTGTNTSVSDVIQSTYKARQ